MNSQGISVEPLFLKIESIHNPFVKRFILLHFDQMLPKWMTVLWTTLPLVMSQSNYASQGNSIEYQPGLPPSTVLNGKVTKLDDISSMIFLNRTKAYLNCSQGSMQVELKFEEPFYGVAYADFDRNSACIFKGRGSNSAKLELPLKGTQHFLSYYLGFIGCTNGCPDNTTVQRISCFLRARFATRKTHARYKSVCKVTMALDSRCVW